MEEREVVRKMVVMVGEFMEKDSGGGSSLKRLWEIL